MTETFQILYAPLLKDVFTQQAQQQLARGAEALSVARSYAHQGKPDFTLAFLLLARCPEDEKRETLAHAYEQRAALTTEKADAYSMQFHRSFPLMKREAHKDLQAARAIRQGQPIER
jgi:hypothetical protein